MAWKKNSGPKKDFRFEPVLELRDAASERGDGGTFFGVGRWSVDGQPKTPKLELRDYWNEEGGGKKYGKSRGLGVSEIELYLKNFQQVNAAVGLAAQIATEAISTGMNGGEKKTFGEWQQAPAPAPAPAEPVGVGEPF